MNDDITVSENSESARRGRAPKARDTPLSFDSVESLEHVEEMNLAYDGVYDYRAFNSAAVNVNIAPLSAREFQTIAEQETFMREMLVIQINESSDKNAPPLVMASLNGDGGWFPRGVPIKMPRGLVGVLLQSQEASYTTPNNPNRDADNGFTIKKKTVNCYPISVLYDPNKKIGRAWMARVLREGC